jgi:hypothetical protein
MVSLSEPVARGISEPVARGRTVAMGGELCPCKSADVKSGGGAG